MNPADRSAVESFVYHEAALLDAGALEDWLELFAEDCLYWIPSRAAAPDPARHVSIVYDDKPRLSARVARLLSGKEYAQEPPSVTCRQVTNVVTRPGADGEIEVNAVLVVYETRPNTAMQAVPAHARWRLTVEDGSLRIREKRVVLTDLDRYYENLTFLL